jgi:hypothetical protein
VHRLSLSLSLPSPPPPSLSLSSLTLFLSIVYLIASISASMRLPSSYFCEYAFAILPSLCVLSHSPPFLFLCSLSLLKLPELCSPSRIVDPRRLLRLQGGAHTPAARGQGRAASFMKSRRTALQGGRTGPLSQAACSAVHATGFSAGVADS